MGPEYWRADHEKEGIILNYYMTKTNTELQTWHSVPNEQIKRQETNKKNSDPLNRRCSEAWRTITNNTNNIQHLPSVTDRELAKHFKQLQKEATNITCEKRVHIGAYDSILIWQLWKALNGFDKNHTLVKVIKDLYDGSSTGISNGKPFAQPFNITKQLGSKVFRMY